MGGIRVRAKLSAQAVVASTQEIAPDEVKTTTASDGTWSLVLQANQDLVPNTTWYTVDIGDLFSAIAIVPQSAGPFKIEDVMSAAPELAGETLIGDRFFRSGIPWIDLKAYAKCDANATVDTSCTSGSAVVTSAAGVFKASDVGKIVDLFGGSGPGITGTQTGTIVAYISATQIQLSFNANANAGNAILVFGTDDTAAVQSWLNATGGIHRAAGGSCLVTGTVTVPAAACKITGGPGTGAFWVSARIGASPFLVMDAGIAGSYLEKLNITASKGVTGRIVKWATANEAGSDFLMRDVNIFSFTDGADYLVFLYANSGTMERCHLNANNNWANKALALSSAISLSNVHDSLLIGRVYLNAQAINLVNCATGPIRATNNSANDGSGSSQQVNTLRLDGCYVYSSSSGGVDYPCVESVAATAAGEGAAGGVFPNIKADASYFVIGSGALAAQYAVSGNFAASQGATGAQFDSCGFIQPATSVATDLTLVRSTGGNPPIYLNACAANILAAVSAAKIFAATAGLGECVVSDFMPSGQATPWQHPAVSATVGVQGNIPASGTSTTRNVYASAFDMWLSLNNAILTRVELSKDGTNWVDLFNDGAAAASRALVVFRWPPGTYIRFTYTNATPKYILLAVP